MSYYNVRVAIAIPTLLLLFVLFYAGDSLRDNGQESLAVFVIVGGAIVLIVANFVLPSVLARKPGSAEPRFDVTNEDECLAYFILALFRPEAVPAWDDWWTEHASLIESLFDHATFVRLKHRQIEGAKVLLLDRKLISESGPSSVGLPVRTRQLIEAYGLQRIR
jgi:hypothetical protein